MPPLSQALSRTSASGGALQSKAVDSSQQWTPPASGHPNASPANLIQPQPQPSNERKPSVHKQGRKNEDATLEARQNLERDNEPAGPQQELTAGVVDNTAPVERSSTASNSDERLSRSASTASEVFSHQSSRPSTNNTSRSSVNPATGNSKTTPLHVSSIASLSAGPTNVRVKPEHSTIFSTPIQETILEATTPSAPTVLTPDTVRSQNTGLNRRISYMTDVGNTKESLTGKLKLKLYRLKTDTRYIDSFGDGNLPPVDGLRQWELAGTAKSKWEDVLKPAIILTMNNNHTAIYGNQLEVRHPRLECTMIGKTARQANPLVRVTHKKKSVCEKLAKLAEKLDVVKQSGFWVTHRQAQNFRAKWELTAPPQAHFRPKTSLVPLSGAQLVVAGNQKRSTIGAVVDTDGRRYGLTVSHVFSDEISDSSEAEYAGDGQYSDDGESEEWTSEYDEEEFRAWMELEDSSTESNTQPEPIAAFVHSLPNPDNETKEEMSWMRQLTTDKGPIWSSVDQGSDWALVELGEYEYRATNESIYQLGTSSAIDVFTHVASSPLTSKSDLFVVTRRGNLLAVACESVSSNEWPIQLRHGEFELGDSGSLVISATDGTVYGILLSGDPLFGSGYVAPAIDIQADLRRTVRTDLQYGEETCHLWPHRQVDVPILPEQYEMFPSKYKFLLDAARIGDFRSISRLIHTEHTQSEEVTEQKKPLVEAAKRYNILTPIADIISTDLDKNSVLDPSSVRQLNEFYRSAAGNGFRGEEADLDAKECFVRILFGRGVDLKDSADIEGTALHQAAEDGNLEIVKALARDLEDIEYVNFRRHKCWSPLHLATREGHVDVVEFLMSHGADVAALSGSEDTREDSVLQIAAWKGNPSVIKFLLDQKATVVSDKGRFGGPMRAAVLSAGRLYNEEMCRIEQDEQKKHPRASLDEIRLEREAKDKLFAIAERYHPSSTETLVVKLEPKLLSDTLPSRSAVLQSVLNILTRFGNSALASRKSPFSAMLAWGSTIFELLLANEASQDFKATDKDLEQAFLVAAEEGPSLLAGVLDDVLHKRLAAGRMREIRSKALCLAASTGELSTVDILLRKSVDVNFKDDDGWTALQLAADAGHLKIVQRLCQQKADLDKRGSGQQTALTCAAGSNKSDASLILEFLLKRYADAKAKTRRRGNGINLAARLGNERSVKLLLARGVNAEIRTVRDGTPLEVAAIRNYTDVVQILLKNLDAKDAEDYLQEAMQSAAVYGSFDTVKLLLDEHPSLHIKGKLLAKVVKSSWVTGGVVDILRKHYASKDLQSRLRILQKSATNWRHATFALPLHPYPGGACPPSSIAACLLQHEDDQSLDVPEEIFIALAEKSDEATISLLMKKSRQLKITELVLAAAARNVFHGDAVLPFLLKACPSSFLYNLTPQQSTSILKAAVGNRELGISMLETVRIWVISWIPASAFRIEYSIFVEAAGNPFHGKALIEQLLQFHLMIHYPDRAQLVITPAIVQAAAQNWSSGDLVLQALLESKHTTFTQDAAVEVILRFTEQGKDMDLERYDVDVLSLLLKREEVIVTPDIMTLVMKRADRKTVEMFEKELPVANDASDIEIEEQIIAAASNMDHGPELVKYLLETRKGIILTERLLDIAAEKDEESEPNMSGNLMMTAFFKSDAAIAVHEFENLLDTVVREFNFETVEALLSRKDLQLTVTRFTLEQAVQNPKATKELLRMLLEYTKTIIPESKIPMAGRNVITILDDLQADLTSSPVVEVALALVPDSIEPALENVPEIQAEPEQVAAQIADKVATEEPSCTETKLAELRDTTPEELVTDNQVDTESDAGSSPRSVDARVDEFVIISAARNVERGKDLVEVLLNYCDATILTERVIKAAVSNRKQAWEIVKLFKDHAEPDTLEAKETSRTMEKAKAPEKVGIQPNTAFWTGRITRRIFQAAMRNWTDSGNNVLLQLLKNDLKALLTRDMFLEIIRQHKLAVVKELFANHSSSFSLNEDTAEDILSAAAANWTAGVRVFRFVINEAKELAAKIIPLSEKIAVAIASNWKSGKEVLDTLLRRYKLRITERVLVATARNPYSGAEIMKVLMRNYTGRISVDLLKAAAENFDDGVPLLKLLLKRGGYTRIPDEVLSAIAGNGSCGPEMLEFLVDGNYVFYLTESTLLAAAKNSVATRVFMVSPVTPGRDLEMTSDLLVQQRDKMKNGNQLLKPPLQYGGIVCLVNMYASRWQECNVLWGLKNGVSEDETWVRRENDWVWGTGRAMLLDLLENHWIPGDLVPDSVLDLATRNFDAEVIRALLQKRDKPITERQLLNATSNEIYAHEVVVALLAEKQLLPPDSVTADVLESAARNPQYGGQLLEVLWTEKSEVTEDLLDAAAGNPSQGEALINFLLERGAKVTTALLETSVDNENQGSMLKLLFEKCDHKNLVIMAKTITSAAENQSIGDKLVKEILQRYPTMGILDEFMPAAAANPGCGAKIMKILLERKHFSEVEDVDEVLVPAASNPKQAIRLLSMLLEKDQVVSGQVWKAAVQNPEIAFEVVSFLVDRKVPAPIPDDVWLVAISEPDIALELLGLLHKQNGDLKVNESLVHAALNNWKLGLEVLKWMKRVAAFEYDIDRALDLAAKNVGCGIEIVNYLLSEHKPAQISPLIWWSAAANLGCGDVLITRLLEYAGNQVELNQPLLLDAAAGNALWSEHIFRALSNVHALPDSPTRISEDVVLILINNWKSGEATIKFLKNSPKWTLAITDVLLQMIVQNTPDNEGPLAVLLEGVDEFEFPEMPDAVSPFWLVRSLKAIELLVIKCRRSSLPQELVKKIMGGWRADAISRMLEGAEITQEAFLNSATNPLNDGTIAKMLQEANPELVVTDEMLQKAVANNIEITKTILDMGQKVSKKALEAAVKGDNTSILELLLGTDAEMKVSDSVLEAAISNGSPKILRVLLQRGLENPLSEHALCKAAEKEDNLEVMKILLAHFTENGSLKTDIPQAVLDEAIDESNVSMVQLLLDHNFATPFTENTWAKAMGESNTEIIQMLLKQDPHFEVTDHILKRAIKSANIYAINLLLERDPNIKITQRMMERAVKCRDVDMLKICAAHIPNKESFNPTERFIERAARNSLEMITAVLEQWPSLQITAAVFERVVRDVDVEVLDFLLEKFPNLPFSTRILVVAANVTVLETFKKILDRAKQQSFIPNDEVLEAVVSRIGLIGAPPRGIPPPPPSYMGNQTKLETVKLILEANKDCVTENALQTAFRQDNMDVETFKLIFLHRPWPPRLVQYEFKTMMRQRPITTKVKFLLEQEVYDLKISPATFTNAAEHFGEQNLRALFESPRAKDCPMAPDLLDTILRGTVSNSSPTAEISPATPWQTTRVDYCVLQKMKVVLTFREVEITMKHVIQAQSLRRTGRQIIQLFLDSPEKAKMTEDVRNYAASVRVVKQLTFQPQPLSTDEGLAIEFTEEDHRILGSGDPSDPASVYSDDDSDSVSSYSSSSDGAAHSLDTLDDSDKRSRENEHPLTYSLPFESYKSGIAVEPAWTSFVEPAVLEHGA